MADHAKRFIAVRWQACFSWKHKIQSNIRLPTLKTKLNQLLQGFLKCGCLTTWNSWTSFLVQYWIIGNGQERRTDSFVSWSKVLAVHNPPKERKGAEMPGILHQATGSMTGHLLQVSFATWLLHIHLFGLKYKSTTSPWFYQKVSHLSTQFLKPHALFKN